LKKTAQTPFMTIQFCGAAREVTGSSHLLTLDNGYKILLDCGLYQGYNNAMKDFNTNWYFKPSEIDCLILSHAHIDHCGRIPKLVVDGYTGGIVSTHATRSLCAIMLLDSAKIQEQDAINYNKRKNEKMEKKNKTHIPVKPLYTAEDATRAMEQFIGVFYDRWFRINEFVEVLFKDAGHILGSASVTLRITEGDKVTHFGFSGDIGRPNRPILRDPQPMPEVDYLICESTYGDKLHESAPNESERLLKIIKRTCVEKKGKLIIPAFSLGRTQEIVYMLDQMSNKGLLPNIPVYVDSPLSVNATTIFGAHPECFDNELHQYLLIDDNPFGFNRLTYVKEVAVSKSLNSLEGGAIIISSSGMMDAGRVRHHLFNSVDNERNTLLIVGYCAPDTLGGMLREGVDQIKLFGKKKPVNMEIEIMDSFSAHADRNELLDFISNQKKSVKKLFLVHGELDRQQSFRSFLEEQGFKNVVEIPKLGETVAL
jgi:metallo-beta-lactamase family protein